MTITPKNAFTQIQSNFWIMLVALMDSFSPARKAAPAGYWIFRRARKVVWIFIATGLATGGLTLGFVAGLLVAKIIG